MTVRLTPRSIGRNVLPCGWCNCNEQEKDLLFDLASFVKDEGAGREAVAILAAAGVTAKLDLSRADEKRFQVKVGACSDHYINLDFYGMLVAHFPLTVSLAQRTVYRERGL